MRVLLAAFLFQLILCGQLHAAQQPEITGAVAYTEAIQFDYMKNGIRNRVQFWLEFKGSPAAGKPGVSGYRAESGAIYYYLYDVDNKKRVDNWLMGFSMMEGPPPKGPYPMSNIRIRGKTSTFEAFGMKWTVTDGGAGYARDKVKIDDGFRVREMKMYDGDLKVAGARIQDDARYQNCLKCHGGPAADLIAKGGKHSSMGCGECHVGHPPAVKKPYRQCTECHQPHSDDMTKGDCKACHKAHTAAEVTYAFDVPPAFCSTCHREAAETLAASKSKHSSMSCALCHPQKHKATSACQYCHGAPHPEHVMKKIGICGDCHGSAHRLESTRPK